MRSSPAPRYTARKPKGPVFETTTSKAVATLTDKQGFVTSEFLELVRQRRMVLGGDGAGLSERTPLVRKDARTALDVCFNIPAHPLRLKPQTVALVPPKGAKTMHPATQGRTAPTIQPQAADHIQLHAQAVNSLHAALHTLLHGDMDQAGIARAIGKATRAATAMKRLAALQLVEG